MTEAQQNRIERVLDEVLEDAQDEVTDVMARGAGPMVQLLAFERAQAMEHAREAVLRELRQIEVDSMRGIEW